MKKSFVQKKWFQGVLKKYEQPLLRYSLMLTGNGQQAEEIVQNAFIKLWNEDFSKVQGFVAPWLYRVCRNEAIDYFRKGQKMVPMDNENQFSEIFYFEEKVEQNRIFKIINNFLPEQQEIFVLKFQDGCTNIEISEITGLSSSNIGIILYRGIKVIKDLLKVEAENA